MSDNMMNGKLPAELDGKALLEEARIARQNAYAPYSGFAVGAALLTKDGKIYRGCNIESSVFSPSLCAERVALAKAISEGEKEFAAIAIVGGPACIEPHSPCFPCGVCRQVLSEHVDGSAFRIVVEEDGEAVSYTLAELLPKTFVFEG